MANVYLKGDMCVSSGNVHADPYNSCVAEASGGKVIRWNEDLALTKEEKKKIEDFVAEADAAPEDRF